jgi:hypothetical protein
MVLAGWLMSSSKALPPSQLFSAIGICVDLRPFPNANPTILITAKRIKTLIETIVNILKRGRLGSGEAASLAGKLGFALSATFGKFGRCRIQPIMKRAHSSTKIVDKYLSTCLQWWLLFVRSFTPRPIPTSLSSLPCIVSYSDGEGGDAGIGAAVWQPGRRPLAVYTEVPDVVREQWRKFQGSEEYQDIFLVEALGPLLLLMSFPKTFRNCLWLHFIDNSAAEASLIRGASSSVVGDHVVGMTWAHIQKAGLWPYFDRVESSANPVDGLSRKRFQGPWERVQVRPFPHG